MTLSSAFSALPFPGRIGSHFALVFALVLSSTLMAAEMPSLVTLKDGRILDGIYNDATGMLMLLPELKMGITLNKNVITSIELSKFEAFNGKYYIKEDAKKMRSGLVKINGSWITKEEAADNETKRQAVTDKRDKEAAQLKAETDEKIKKGLVLVIDEWMTKEAAEATRATISGTVAVQTRGGSIRRMAKGRIALVPQDVFLNNSALKEWRKNPSSTNEDLFLLMSGYLKDSILRTDLNGGYSIRVYPGIYFLVCIMETQSEVILWTVGVAALPKATLSLDLDHTNTLSIINLSP